MAPSVRYASRTQGTLVTYDLRISIARYKLIDQGCISFMVKIYLICIS